MTPMWMAEPRYLDVGGVAAYLSKSPEAVRMMVKRAQIPHLRMGQRTVRFDREMIDRWMAKQVDRRKPQ